MSPPDAPRAPRALVVILTFAVCSALVPRLAGQAAAAPQAPPAWEVVCVWLRAQTDQLSDDLEVARIALLERAREEQPALAASLEQPAPSKLRPGWGVLPEVVPSRPPKAVPLAERTYSLGEISRNFVTAFRDGRVLAEHTAASADALLGPAVKTYERLKKDLRNVQQHLAYHEEWQRAVEEQHAFFAERNGIVAQVRELQALRKIDAAVQRQQELERAIREAVAPFDPAPGLALESTEDGALVLPVTVLTDIDDQALLDAFRDAVVLAWNGADAARERGLSIDLDIVGVSPDELYPAGAPERGASIVVKDHVARFPEGALVMTTGAASTHAWRGRSLILGPQPITPRTMAHEFGHLLGFSDAYLRGYDGTLGSPNGVTLVEWTGLVEDLMGNAGGGRVTTALVDQLIEAYGQP